MTDSEPQQLDKGEDAESYQVAMTSNVLVVMLLVLFENGRIHKNYFSEFPDLNR